MKKHNRGIESNCIVCDTKYILYPTTKLKLCARCRQKEYNKRNKLTEEERKKPYPLTPSQKLSRYRSLKKQLAKLNNKKEMAAFWDKQLDFIIESGIWTWCIDLRPTKPRHLMEAGKRGRKPNEQIRASLKYPNTKDAEL